MGTEIETEIDIDCHVVDPCLNGVSLHDYIIKKVHNMIKNLPCFKDKLFNINEIHVRPDGDVDIKIEEHVV